MSNTSELKSHTMRLPCEVSVLVGFEKVRGMRKEEVAGESVLEIKKLSNIKKTQQLSDRLLYTCMSFYDGF